MGGGGGGGGGRHSAEEGQNPLAECVTPDRTRLGGGGGGDKIRYDTGLKALAKGKIKIFDEEGNYISAGPEAGPTLCVNVANQNANHQRREKPHRAQLQNARPRNLLRWYVFSLLSGRGGGGGGGGGTA